MEDTIKPFMRKSIEVQDTLLDIFDKLLGFPIGTLRDRHRLEETSGTETRNIRNPPRMKAKQLGLGSHTDFGTMVSTLHNNQKYLLIILLIVL
jgi:hypothetical protein